jgi:hypothetical protein
VAGVLAALAVVLALGTLFVNGEAIIQKQIKQQRLIFEPLVNDQLYTYFREQGGPELVISSYPVGWLPELEAYWHNERFNDYAEYRAALERFPEAQLLLLRTDNSDERIWAEIQAGLADGTYSEIFTQGNYILVRIPTRE